jgi:hypothetical protein
MFHLLTVFSFLCPFPIAVSTDIPVTEPQTSVASSVPEAPVADKTQARVETASSPGEAPSPAWTLRYKFQPHQTLRYETRQQMTLEAQQAENRKVDTSELIQRRRFTVLSAAESGAARIAMQFEHVWMKMQTDDHPAIEFDSSMHPGDVPVAFREAAHQLRGRAPRYWLSDRGVSLYRQPNSGLATPSRGSQVTQTSATKDSNDAIQLAEGILLPKDSEPKQQETKDPGSFLIPLPAFPLGIGESWTETTTVTVRLTEEISRQIPILQSYRLEAVTDGIATISLNSSVEAPGLTVPVQAQLIQATPRGRIQFDIDRGVVTLREMTYDAAVPGAFGQESLLTSTGTSTERLLGE